MRNFCEFSPNHSKFTKFHFDGLFLSKLYDIWAKKYRGAIFHDLEQWSKIWINPGLVVSKFSWETGCIFIRAHKSEIVYTNYTHFCRKCIMFQLKNFARVMCQDTKRWCKEKLNRGLKNYIKNLVDFPASSWKSGNLHFHRLIFPKAYNDLDKKKAQNNRKVMSHDNEEWCKVWRKTSSWFQKWHEEFGEF